jgi:hypothetical protein
MGLSMNKQKTWIHKKEGLAITELGEGYLQALQTNLTNSGGCKI